MNRPEISKMLTLSTSHISAATAAQLAKNDQITVPYYPKSDFGWFIYIDRELCQSADKTDAQQIPKDLQALIYYANDLDCEILCLDSDGPIIPYLQKYKHE